MRRQQVPHRRQFRKSAIFAIVHFLATIHLVADLSGLEPDWPHWRGPHYNGTANDVDLADTWPPQGPPVLWTRKLGTGYSGFVASGERVFTLAQSEFSQFVVCLDAGSGVEIWRYRFGWPYDGGGMYPGPRATPTIANGCVYFAGPRGLIGCLRLDDGQLVWSVNVIDRFMGKGFDFGYAASPLVTNGLVIVPAGGEGASVVALDAATGELVWNSGDEAASYVGAIPISVDENLHAVVFLQSSLAAFDVDSGQQLWQHTFSQGYDEHAVAPIYREPYLLIASPFKAGAQMYHVRSVTSDVESRRFEAQWMWDSLKLSNDTASSVLVDDYVFGFDLQDLQSKRRRPSRGEFRCLAWPTGEVLWSSDSPGHSTVVAADDKLFAFNDKGELILVKSSPDGYQQLGRGQVFEGEICWTSPALHRGRLFVRSPSRCACVFVGEPSALGEAVKATTPLSQIPKATAIDLSWLVAGERPYPFDTHSFDELSRWFSASLAGICVALTFAGLTVGVSTAASARPVRRLGNIVFWGSLIVVGILLTPLLNRTQASFYFTWPLSLYAIFQITIVAFFWSRHSTSTRFPPACSRIVLLTFAFACVGYFLLCRHLSHSMEWMFLVGFLPSSLVAIPTGYLLCQPRRWLQKLLCVIVSFSCYFWTSAAVNVWIKWRS